MNTFLSYIDKGSKKQIEEKLDNCKEMYHSLLNFDLIPRTGSLNNIKGSLKIKNNKILVHDLGKKPKKCHDRLDTFISFLDNSFKEKRSLFDLVIDECNLERIGTFFQTQCSLAL